MQETKPDRTPQRNKKKRFKYMPSTIDSTSKLQIGKDTENVITIINQLVLIKALPEHATNN